MGGHQDDPTGPEVGGNGLVPVGEHPDHDVGQAFGQRRFDVGVALVVVGVERVVIGDGWRRGRIAATPGLELFVAVTLPGLGLVEACEVAVVAFVEPPVPTHRDP